MVRKDQTRNLEIPGSMLTHRPGMTAYGRHFASARFGGVAGHDLISVS
jgi:hypothetical protein